MQDEKRIESYEKIIEYEKKVHESNQNRIRIGIRLVIIIPLIFLAVMFKMGSSKVVFLVLWIVSLFALSLYLIIVEYMDYQMQIKLKEFGIKDEKDDIRNLISDELVVEKIAPSDEKADNQPVETATVIRQPDEMSQAEEELVESIRKYVVTLGKQAVQTSMADSPQRKEAQDYAAMRKARATARRTRSREDGME